MTKKWTNNLAIWSHWPRDIVVAQLAERSLPTPEIHGSNPAIGKFYSLSTVSHLFWKDENKEKDAGNGPFKKGFLKETQFVFATRPDAGSTNGSNLKI